MQTRPHTCTFRPEDLLGRSPIVLDRDNIIREIKGRSVLITGAAGTIGSELAAQVCACAPARLVLVDQAESPLHDLDLLLTEQYPQTDINTCIGSITDALRMSDIFAHSKVDTVLHAAAYKHVPLMERHPYEVIKTNVFGTKILADLAVSHGVGKFVYISTDKAIKPASVMGATKRFAEIYLQNLANRFPDRTRFIITRFGNVLGSNGSFLLRFAQQIREGGPITVTHPHAERYMMTVTEACQLVLAAAAISNGHEILSFDMGEPVRVADMAKRMIELAGLGPGTDIQIRFTGLRPGEKLSEEPPSGPACARGKIQSTAFSGDAASWMQQWLPALQNALTSCEPERMVSILKSAIPEYISANSPFARLDVLRQASEAVAPAV
ncbi:polysaccharide biosynthesis protein [Dyadobacter fermentans]|uniref:Polysaccharide biosynthesis protein CapD n=1 Tax=Dyadobacter fermentans (strain ATCC 700827 / DSM 18053 / CIP 107007 / KCTC 52180 / NS114) TaxID=471854 RepID=C6VXR6_DYAFD|nr:polysaccharide biosynthesis protein [Dyadobacter fermentans]ACT95099.1 polysaccharide biosynthesis protein CapD [Dyadobacter fermentans DSM 18053]